MDEKLTVKSFGPVKDLDIHFGKITVFIGDQGTGKSCVAKLFSLFKWLGKDLNMQRTKASYYERGKIFLSRVCAYHRIDNFFSGETHIRFEDSNFIFEFSSGKFHITEKEGGAITLPKIIYVPAERTVLSVAETNTRILKELPSSCSTFNDEFTDAKLFYKKGMDLPFSNLHFEYDQLNQTSRISGPGYEDAPVKLMNASSSIQSALPLCLVSDYLSEKVANNGEPVLTPEEKEKLRKQVDEIMSSGQSAQVKEALLNRLSSRSSYGCFINITEEPELNLFPASQRGVIQSLIRDNRKTDTNQLVLTTHSPYTLAIINLLVMAGKVWNESPDNLKEAVESIVPRMFHIHSGEVRAFGLSHDDDKSYCRSIIDPSTGMISTNSLDSISDAISGDFNKLLRCYARAHRNK